MAEDEVGAAGSSGADKAAAESDWPSNADQEHCDAPRAKRPKWLPLESNPDILNGFMERVGVAGGWSFSDVVSLDSELLAMVPQPVMAVCLLFPSKSIRRPRSEALAEKPDAQKAPARTFYLIQHKEFGNACGTIAAVHTIGNLARAGCLQLVPGSAIEAFLQEASELSPDDAGRLLAQAAPLHEASDAAARSHRAQTRTPGRDESVEGHFIVFLEVDGHVLELDGCMGFPVNHGKTSSSGFLQDVASLIQKDFMARAPGDPNFSVMALTPAVDGAAEDPWSGGGGRAEATIDESQVDALVCMGFEAGQVREALRAACGNADSAVELLLSS